MELKPADPPRGEAATGVGPPVLRGPTLDAVLVTQNLTSRPARVADARAEARALHALARAFDETPQAALDALMREALALCLPSGNGTTGVSLLEGQGEAALFRWTAMAGRLAQHVGGTTPRAFSPCGVCLDHDAPVLFSRPDTYFTYFLATGLPFVEGLVLPFRVDGVAAGTIWIVSHDDSHGFDAEDVRIMASLADFTGAAYAALRAREALDATARERERLLAAERSARQDAEAASRAKGSFLAMMSHELRTPLNAIGGYIDLLEMELRGPITPEQRVDLSRIRASQRHLLGLINQVLDYARIEANGLRYDLTDVPLCEALAATELLIAPQMRACGLAFVLEEVPAALAVRADGEKLQQILLNLLSNATKFTGAGGEVRVGCAAHEAAVTIAISDTGIGIAPEQLASVFEPFVQVDQRLARPHEGVGLGLAISRELARGMGGELHVQSAPGVGSTFTITLPRV